MSAMQHLHERRCSWCEGDPLYIAYHDNEWGVPVHDDGLLFEMLILEGAQAGLNWLTILKKRANYRAAFDAFDANKIAAYNHCDIQRLMQNSGIVRNRLKIEAAITNARMTIEVQNRYGTLNDFLWRYVNGMPVQNNFRPNTLLPTRSPPSDALSKDLKQLGFKFVGSTICYAWMQAIGMVNDHYIDCFRHAPLSQTTSF